MKALLEQNPFEAWTGGRGTGGGRPILFLPDRDSNSGLPVGLTPLDIDGKAYEADFVKVALNVVHLPGEDQNRLPEILRGWFGPDAGRPGTRHKVALAEADGHWTLRRLGTPKGAS